MIKRRTASRGLCNTMPPADKDTRSLDLCAIGLGQGGGNLAAEWRRRGYRTLLLNTARSDLSAVGRQEGLDVPDKYRMHIGIGDTDGAGRDPEYGARCVEHHADEIKDAVARHLDGADALIVCAGLGGGTGSSVYALLDVLEPLDIPVIAVVTLPSQAESGITKVNAVRTANALVTAPLHGRVFIDNARLVDAFPDVDIISYYPRVNSKVLGPLDALNRLNRSDDRWSIRSFDAEDLRKVLLSGGVLQTHVHVFEDGLTSPTQLVDAAAYCVDGGAHLAAGLSLDKCAYLAVVVTGPEEALRKTSIKVFDDGAALIKEHTKGGAVYEGLYVVDDKNAKVTAHILSASLALPARVESLLAEARAEGQELMNKIQADIPQLEISPLEGLDLFRAPSRRSRRAPRPDAPKPRPLAAQLLSQVDAVAVSEVAPPHEPSADPSLQELSDIGDLDAMEATAHVDEAQKKQVSEPAAHRTPSRVAALPGERAQPHERTGVFDEAPLSDDEDEPNPYVPRVGTGQMDMASDVENLEPTAYVAQDAADDASRRGKVALMTEEGLSVEGVSLPDDVSLPSVDADALFAESEASEESILPAPSEAPDERRTAKKRGRGTQVRIGTGRHDDDPYQESPEKTESVPQEEVNDALLAAGENGMFEAEELPSEFELGEEADQFELPASLTKPVDDDAIIAADDVPRDVPSNFDQSDEDTAGAPPPHSFQAQPTLVSQVDELLLSSLREASRQSGTVVQNVYEDLIDRFRQAPDKRGRERVARRLMDDAKSDDVEVRALAVWAMAKLEQRGFKRALSKSTNDKNPEIAKLALTGLEQIAFKEQQRAKRKAKRSRS